MSGAELNRFVFQRDPNEVRERTGHMEGRKDGCKRDECSGVGKGRTVGVGEAKFVDPREKSEREKEKREKKKREKKKREREKQEC